MSANDFIVTHRKTFGLLGTNTRSDHSVSDLSSFGSQGFYSRRNHFRFGYDASLFWTQYGSPELPVADFQTEVRNTFLEISKRFGRFSLPDTGTLASEFLIRSAAKLNLEFDTLRLLIDEQGPPPLGVTHSGNDLVFKMSLDEFKTSLETFARVARGRRIETGYYALLGSLSDLPHIYDGFFLRLVNLNVDFVRDVPVGPAHWALVDNERYFVGFRHLIAEKKNGIPNFLKFSPELIASFLAHPIWREQMKQDPNARNNSHEEIRILRSLHPEIRDRDFFRSPTAHLNEKISEDALLKITGLCERQWFTPLETFTERFRQ